MSQSPTLKAISLYTGAGGLDYGFEAAGYETRIAVEMDKQCCKTLRANRDWEIIENSILETSTENILNQAQLIQGEADILIGGPPCQPFSKSGFWATGDSKRLLDDRAKTLGAYFNVLEAALPKTFILENVPGLAFSGKSEGIALIEELIIDINKKHGTSYTFSVKQLNAVDYGVPQQRERVFIIGSRDGLSFKFPEPLFFSDSREKPYFSSWDAIGGITPDTDDEIVATKMTGKWADLIKSIPEGGNYLYHTERGGGLPLFGWRRRYWNFLLKLSKNRPAWTIQAQPGPATGPFHWDNRKLSVKEICKLQTFPNDIKILGTQREAQKQVGNAVPSLLAEVLAREIATQLLGKKPYKKRLSLLPERKASVPPPVPVQPVEKKYKDLIGDHKPHPGTGMGNRAMAFKARTSET